MSEHGELGKNPGIVTRLDFEAMQTSASFLDAFDDGNHKFVSDNQYPRGTYPVAPASLGQEFGWNAVIKPEHIKVGHPELESRPDFQLAILDGIRAALTCNPDLGEESDPRV